MDITVKKQTVGVIEEWQWAALRTGHTASDSAGWGGSLSSSTGCLAIQASRTPWCAAATTHRATSADGSRFLPAADVSTGFVIMPVRPQQTCAENDTHHLPAVKAAHSGQQAPGERAHWWRQPACRAGILGGASCCTCGAHDIAQGLRVLSCDGTRAADRDAHVPGAAGGLKLM